MHEDSSALTLLLAELLESWCTCELVSCWWAVGELVVSWCTGELVSASYAFAPKRPGPHSAAYSGLDGAPCSLWAGLSNDGTGQGGISGILMIIIFITLMMLVIITLTIMVHLSHCL